MQASLGVDRVWMQDDELTVVSHAVVAGEVRLVARRASDGAEVEGNAQAGEQGTHLRLRFADLVPAGPETEDWLLEALVDGSALSLVPGPAYTGVLDPSTAFAFPAARVQIGAVPRRLRPRYNAAAQLTIRSTAPRGPRPAPRPSTRIAARARTLLGRTLTPARMLAHRPAHAVFAALMRRRPAPAPAQRPKVTIVLGHAWGIGGTTRTCLNLAGYLAESHDVTVLSVVRYRDAPRVPFPAGVTVVAVDDQRTSHGPVERLLRRLPPVLLLPQDRRMSRWASLWTDVLLARALWRLRADVVMTTRPALNVLGAALARPGVLVVGQEHINLRTHRDELRRVIARRYRRLDTLVTLVERDREEYQALLGHTVRVECIPNAVPALPGPPAALESHMVLAVGRLTAQKGFGRLVEAFAQVVREHPDWTLRICGDGPQRKPIERMIRRHELHNNVLLLGFVKDVSAQLSRASLFAMSSRFEGLPMAMIEAMSKGLPVVSFDCPTGPAEILEPGRSGLLVPEGDVDGLARAIRVLIEDEPLRRQLGAGAAARAADFSMESVGERWDALLR